MIGINGYPNAPLTGCVSDAIAFGSIIERNGDGSPNFSVKTIADTTGETTKGGLKGSIKELFEGDSDAALLYFSGHGLFNELGGYIVTPDYQTNDEGISMDEILTLADKSKAKDKIIILDCCHSGAFGQREIVDGKSIISEGVSILTASRNSESSIEIGGHGVFTSLLLDALQGGASDVLGQITPGGIYAYIDQALGAWDQRPTFKTNVSRFTCIRRSSPRISIEVLRKVSQFFPTPEHQFALDPTFEFTEKSANAENVAVFKDLQKLQSVGLVVPVDADYMYFAAINSKSCRLTAVGHLYWKLSKEGKI